MDFDAAAAASQLMARHKARASYSDLPPGLQPTSLEQAYAAQEALLPLLGALYGTVGGAKIAVTTKVMQEFMGIHEPCCGALFTGQMLASPARVRFGDFSGLKLECEIALRLGRDLAPGTGHTAESVAAAVSHAMPAFEIVDDRNADYKKVNVLTIIADNCWNAGIVLGRGIPFDGVQLGGRAAAVKADGAEISSGITEEALGALAFTANLLGSRGRPLKAGEVVMTGSVVPTFPTAAGKRYVFSIEGMGDADLTVE